MSARCSCVLSLCVILFWQHVVYTIVVFEECALFVLVRICAFEENVIFFIYFFLKKRTKIFQAEGNKGFAEWRQDFRWVLGVLTTNSSSSSRDRQPDAWQKNHLLWFWAYAHVFVKVFSLYYLKSFVYSRQQRAWTVKYWKVFVWFVSNLFFEAFCLTYWGQVEYY